MRLHQKIPAFFIFLAVLFMSFAKSDLSEITGTYGVCDTDPSGIKLVINSDKTFTYTDLSDSNKEIRAEGYWEFIKNHVQLYPNNKKVDFHTKWKIATDGSYAKSRYKMCFYRLTKLN